MRVEKNNLDYVDNILVNYFNNISYEIPEFILRNTEKTINGLSKNSKLIEIIKKLILTLIGLMTLTSGVYAGVKYVVQKKDYSAIETVLEHKENSYLATGNTISGLSLEDDIWYKKIDTYDEYLRFDKELKNIPEMSESDFEKEFLVLLLGRNNGIYIDNIETMEDTLIFNIRRNIDNDTKDICVKVSREKEREKIKIDFHYQMPNMIGYAGIDDLPYDYTKEQAIEDGCVVLLGGHGEKEYSEYIFGKEKLERFIEDSKNGINCNIRIVEYETSWRHRGYDTNPNGANILDIEFKDGKYIVCMDMIRTIINPEQYDEEHDNYKLCFISDEFEVVYGNWSWCGSNNIVYYGLNSSEADGENAHVWIYVKY